MILHIRNSKMVWPARTGLGKIDGSVVNFSHWNNSPGNSPLLPNISVHQFLSFKFLFLSLTSLFRYPTSNFLYIWKKVGNKKNFFLRFLFVYLRENTSRGRDTRRGRSRLPAEHGAWRGPWSQDSGIVTWAEGRLWINEPPRHPRF